MTQIPIDLIVCSSAPRWRASVRIAVKDSLGRWPALTIRLLEVEELAQITPALQSSAGAVLGLEAGEENLRVVQSWMRDFRRQDVPVVGLLSMSAPPTDMFSGEAHHQRLAALATLIREAGAVWTLNSPLEAMDLLKIARRHHERMARQYSDCQRGAADIWRLLPWQSTRCPLRLTTEA